MRPSPRLIPLPAAYGRRYATAHARSTGRFHAHHAMRFSFSPFDRLLSSRLRGEIDATRTFSASALLPIFFRHAPHSTITQARRGDSCSWLGARIMMSMGYSATLLCVCCGYSRRCFSVARHSRGRDISSPSSVMIIRFLDASGHTDGLTPARFCSGAHMMFLRLAFLSFMSRHLRQIRRRKYATIAITARSSIYVAALSPFPRSIPGGFSRRCDCFGGISAVYIPGFASLITQSFRASALPGFIGR